MLKDTAYAIRIYDTNTDNSTGYLLFSNTDKSRADVFRARYVYIRITDQDMIDTLISANSAGNRITFGFHDSLQRHLHPSAPDDMLSFEIPQNKGLVSLAKGTEAQPSELLICIKDRDVSPFYIAYPARKTENVLIIDIDEYY